MPRQANWYFCSWDHHEAHFREHDYRGYVRTHEAEYDRGYWDGSRMRFQTDPGMPLRIWALLRSLVAPDRRGALPPLQRPLAEECAQWLDAHQPAETAQWPADS